MNLERPLRADGEFGGHFVTGHVDGLGKIFRWEKSGADHVLDIAAPEDVMRYVIHKGSIAIDGISLTVAGVGKKSFCVWIIPHTFEVTALRERKVGDRGESGGRFARQIRGKVPFPPPEKVTPPPCECNINLPQIDSLNQTAGKNPSGCRSRRRNMPSALACQADEIHAAQTLRFQVFNLELNEGLAHSYATGRDADAFDAVCDHLLVEHLPSRQIVGTYRLQTGANAAKNLGYYSAQEFDFDLFEPLRIKSSNWAAPVFTGSIGISWCSGPALERHCGLCDGTAARAIFSAAVPSPRRMPPLAPRLIPNFAAKNIWRKFPGKRGQRQNLIVRLTAWRKNRFRSPNCCAPIFRSARRFAARQPLTASLKRLIFLTLVDLKQLSVAARERFLS